MCFLKTTHTYAHTHSTLGSTGGPWDYLGLRIYRSINASTVIFNLGTQKMVKISCLCGS